MERKLTENLLKVCGALQKHNVAYLIIGGTAVALYGYFRMSINIWGNVTVKPDLDIWYNPSYENYFRLLNALEELGQDVKEFKKEKSPNPKQSFFKFDTPDFSLDLLPEIKVPLNFSLSYQNRETMTIKGIDIDFIGYADLIKDKEATGRSKDLDDIEQLKKRN